MYRNRRINRFQNTTQQRNKVKAIELPDFFEIKAVKSQTRVNFQNATNGKGLKKILKTDDVAAVNLENSPEK